MNMVIDSIKLPGWQAHHLHAEDRLWPQTNCYTDLWIEILAARKLDPRAMLGFTLVQDFEGDQFTFFKVPLEDLDTIFGIRVTELAIFDNLAQHIHEQVARGRMPLVEVDSYYLPDTRGISYQSTHQKTTIGINAIDTSAQRLEYFHNSGYYSLAGEDYLGAMQMLPQQCDGAVLFPYTEFAKFPDRKIEPSSGTALDILRRHLDRRPRENPVKAYAGRLDEHLAALGSRGESYFHTYAFNTIRQLGANHELLASHLDWMAAHTGIDFDASVQCAKTISEGAKVLQFQLARALKRGRLEKLHETLIPMMAAWDQLSFSLAGTMGSIKSAA